MRVGLVSPYSWSVPGGVNSHIANLATELEERGHEAWILAPSRDSGSKAGAVPVPEHFISMGTAVPFRSNGSRAHVNTSPLILSRMDRILRELQPDLLHAHEPCTPTVAGAAVLRATVPVVGTFHAALDHSLLYEMMFPLAKRIVESLAIKIAVSEAAREYPGSRFPGEYRIIPNGVRLDEYSPAREGRATHGRILFIGRAEPRKGLAVALHAFALVRREIPDATFSLVGPRWEQVISQAPQPGRGLAWPLNGVNALGRVGHADKIAEMSAAEVICMPSLEGESFGIVIAESMAAGLPVVASDLPGYRSVLRDGKAGVLVPPRDPQALAKALVRVLRDGALRTRLRTAGIAAAEDLSWETVATRVIAVYDEALAAAPAARPRRTRTRA